MNSKTLIALALVLSAAAPARAQSAAEVMREAGFEGTWSANCSAPPSDRNGYHTYVYEGDRVREARDFGTSSDSSDVIQARILDDGTVEVVTRNAQFTWRVVYRRIGDNRTRAITSGEYGTQKFSVENGRFVHNGRDTQPLVRCK